MIHHPATHDRTDKPAIYARIARVIGGVLLQALETTGATAIVLMDDESAEGMLVARILADAAIPVTEYADAASTLTAHPATKTALLAGSFVPRVDLFPLGDLYASQLNLLTGEWSGDDGLHALAKRAGGIEQLDHLLQSHIDRRIPLEECPDPGGSRAELQVALEKTRFRRSHAGLVPKLGPRTIGIDLLE